MATLSSDDESFEVAEILDSRGRGASLQYLVRWKGYESGDDTWETAKHLKNSGDAIETFKKEKKTPGRRKSTKQVEKSVEKSSKAGKSVTRTTTTTRVETRTLSGAQSQSEASSPESSPRLTRRTAYTRVIQQSEKSEKKPSAPSKCAGIWKMFCNLDFPTIIVLLCFLFIVLTFIVQPIKK